MKQFGASAPFEATVPPVAGQNEEDLVSLVSRHRISRVEPFRLPDVIAVQLAELRVEWRPNLATPISISICACVGADLTHEAIGHGLASLLAGNHILPISTLPACPQIG